MEELISVIIPVYNSEIYLKKCLESVINQTYDNLEIIIVDDGSLDNSGKICDEYSFIDKRIKCIHTHNKGVSAARNIGLDNATGQYIGFVDSDDFIEPEFFDVLINDIKQYNVDIAFCDFDTLKKDKSHIECLFNESKIINSREAIRLLLEEKIDCHLWNKLFKAFVFENCRFKIDKIYEDILIMDTLFSRSNKIYYDQRSLYHYIWRENSLVHCNSFDSIYDNFNSRFIVMKNFSNEFPKETSNIMNKLIRIYIWMCYACAIESKQNFKKYLKILAEVKKNLRSELRKRRPKDKLYVPGDRKFFLRVFMAINFMTLYVYLEKYRFLFKQILKSKSRK